MAVDGPPTAEGDLAGTPFAHLVVYALERKLTGTLLLAEAEDRVHTLTFERGTAAKCRPGDDFAPIGRLLLDEGVIEESVLEAALSTHGLMSQAGLLGDMLVMAGHVEPEALDRVLERQFRLRFTRLFALPGPTRYAWYEGVDRLADWGAEPARLDPFELLWAGLERHGDKASSMEPTLAALGEQQSLAIHPRAPLERLGLEGLASEIVELLLLEPVSLPELCSLDVAPPELCRRVVFAMLLLRFVDLGRGALPIGVVDKAPTTLARVRLKQATRQRLVAAAEDEVGDGERAPSRRRGVDPRRDSTPHGAPVSQAPSAEGAPAAEPAPGPPPRPRPPEKPLVLEPEEPEPDSSVRAIRSVIEGKPTGDLLSLGRARIAARDAATALQLAEAALEREPQLAEARLLAVTARALMPHSDAKALVLQLDEIVAGDDRLAEARWQRGLLRKRLGDDAGARRDFERVVELEPDHEGARARLAGEGEQGKPAGAKGGGLLGRLFRR
jgi:hypothetical protein